MKRIGCFLLIVLVSSCAMSADTQIDKKVEKLLSQMSLEEKAGQMTQVTLEVVSTLENGTVKLNGEKLTEAIVKYKVGSILNCGGQAQTVDNWHKILKEMQDVAVSRTPHGIPIIYGIDSIHGANYVVGATLFPQSIAMAASGNNELVRKAGEITAIETRAAGIPWNFNPVLCSGRQPLWPRMYETFGEDPYVISMMGAEYIKGLQGDNADIAQSNRVAGCMKHYLGYGEPRTGRDRTPAWIPDIYLRQIYLPPFKAAVDAGVVTVMVNSSEINGIPVHSSDYYLKKILRDELGFKGFIVTDWNDINNLYTREMVASSQREAVKMAVLAGIDMSMVPFDYSFYEHVVDLAKTGEIPQSRIDDAVRNILRVKFQLGLFDTPYPDVKLKEKVGQPQFAEVNYQAACEVVTLLKNKNTVLPVSAGKKVLVTGPSANAMCYLNGGWTLVWQGDKEELYPKDKDTILEAIEKTAGRENTTYVKGVAFDKEEDINTAVEAAGKADVVIACIGEPTYTETPGVIEDLTITAPQRKLISELKKAGKPVILVLVEGRPRVISEIEGLADGILLAYLPGMEGGRAIADVLFGKVNPSAKLPYTYPRHPNGYTTYDHKKSEEADANKFDPQWEFGFGLSYTTFEYSNLKLDKRTIGLDDKINISVDVKNTGKRNGKEVVQLFIADTVASITPPVKQLKRYTKIELEAGQSQTVKFTLNKDDLAFVGRENKWIVEPGEFLVMAGPLKDVFILK